MNNIVCVLKNEIKLIPISFNFIQQQVISQQLDIFGIISSQSCFKQSCSNKVTKMRDLKLPLELQVLMNTLKQVFLHMISIIILVTFLNDNLYMEGRGKDVGVIYTKVFEILGEKTGRN